MVPLPNLVQDLPLTRLSNSVLVGTAKFTLDQWQIFFTHANPAPTRVAAQFQSYSASYDALNAAYALTRESLLTQDVFNLDQEGDQLFIGFKETVAGAQRMTYVPARKQAGDRLNVFAKKYKVDTKENMISEWSKLQQLTEEAAGSESIMADIATLGLTEMMARLSEIANELRDKLTQRSNELPALKAMKQAREAFYPEYRALIQLLNAAALINEDTMKYASFIQTLNRNIDYVRIHAMSNGGSSNEGNESNQNNQNNQSNSENSGNSENNGGEGTNTNPTNPTNNGDDDEIPGSGGGEVGGGGNQGGGSNNGDDDVIPGGDGGNTYGGTGEE